MISQTISQTNDGFRDGLQYHRRGEDIFCESIRITIYDSDNRLKQNQNSSICISIEDCEFF